MGRRLGLMPWLGLWAAATGLQIAAFVVVGPQSPGLAVAAALLLQVAKVPIGAWRLTDLGRPPDDAMLGLIPLANVAVWRDLLRGTPSEAERERAMSRWAGASLASALFTRGLADLAAAPGAALGTAVLFGGLFAVGELGAVDLLLSVEDRDPESVGIAIQALWGIAAFLLAYLVVQFFKRKTASRASWWPVFLLLPAALSAFTLQITLAAAQSPPRPDDPMGGLMPVLLATTAWNLAWMCLGGAALGVAWVTIVQGGRAGRVASFGQVLAAVRRRGLDVAGPHGAAALIIQLGMQVVLPGIFYALEYAFVDAVAMLEPERSALRGSRTVGRGIRRRIVKVYVLGLLTALALGIAVALPTELVLLGGTVPPGEVLVRVLIGVPTILIAFPVHASGLTPLTFLPVAMVSTLSWGVARMALVHLYHERSEAQAAGEGAGSAS